MGSGVSVPADSETVAGLLSVLPEEERAGLNLSPTKGDSDEINDDLGDQVPHQIKMKVARLVMSAMASSPDQNRITMNSQVLQRLSELPRLLNDIESSRDPDRRRDAVEQVRRFLSIEQDPPIQVVIDAGCVPTLVGFLDFDDDPKLQLEAGWALTNIASGTSAQTDTVIDAGALPCFVRLLKISSSPQVREQAIWALGNIAGDSAARRDQALNAGCLAPLLSELLSHTTASSNEEGEATPPPRQQQSSSSSSDCLSRPEVSESEESSPASLRSSGGGSGSSGAGAAGAATAPRDSTNDDSSSSSSSSSPTSAQRTSILRNGTWLLSNLCRGKPRVDLDVMRPSLPVLAHIVEHAFQHDDEETLMDALWAVSYLSDGEQENIDAVVFGADAKSISEPGGNWSSSSPLSFSRYRQRGLGGEGGVNNREQHSFAAGERKDNEDEEKKEDGVGDVPSFSSSSPSSRSTPKVGSLVGRLVRLLAHGSPKVQTPALRCVGNLVTGDDESTEAMVGSPGCLRALRNLLLLSTSSSAHGSSKGGGLATNNKTSAALKKEACWTLSNVTAGTTSQVQAVLDADVLPPLLALAALDNSASRSGGGNGSGAAPWSRTRRYQQRRSSPPHEDDDDDGGEDEDGENLMTTHYTRGKGTAAAGATSVSVSQQLGSTAADVQKEAVWAVANAASGATKRQVRHLVRAGSVRSLCTALGSAKDPRVCSVAIDGLTQLLRKAGGGGRGGGGGNSSSSSVASNRRRFGGGAGACAVVRGTPAYRWRRRVVKAVRQCGGEGVLKRIVIQHSGGGGGGSKGGSSSKKGGGSSKKFSSSAGEEAATKAQALLGLVTLTKEVLSRARREAKKGGSGGKGGKGYRRRRGRSDDADDEEDEGGEDEEDEDEEEEEEEEDDDEEQDDEEFMNAEDRAEVARLVARFADVGSTVGVGGVEGGGDDDSDDDAFEGGGVDDWGDDNDDGGGGAQGGCSSPVSGGRRGGGGGGEDGGGFGEFSGDNNNNCTPARVVVVGARKTPTSSGHGHGGAGLHEASSGGKVMVRRLGPSGDGGEEKDNNNFDDGGGFGGPHQSSSKSNDSKGQVHALSNEFAVSHMEEAMAALERELGLVQLDDDDEEGVGGGSGDRQKKHLQGGGNAGDNGKRGWTSAWNV